MDAHGTTLCVEKLARLFPHDIAPGVKQRCIEVAINGAAMGIPPVKVRACAPAVRLVFLYCCAPYRSRERSLVQDDLVSAKKILQRTSASTDWFNTCYEQLAAHANERDHMVTLLAGLAAQPHLLADLASGPSFSENLPGQANSSAALSDEGAAHSDCHVYWRSTNPLTILRATHSIPAEGCIHSTAVAHLGGSQQCTQVTEAQRSALSRQAERWAWLCAEANCTTCPQPATPCLRRIQA
jgi:hypothetical protein